jgi:ParB-like chromosome segregation protein Spo0J
MPKKNKQTNTVTKPVKLKMPKVRKGRKDEVESLALKPATGLTTLAEIEELIAKSNGTPAPAVTQLDRDDIHAAEVGAFQWRHPEQHRSADHIHALVRALRTTGTPFEPILVFWAGGRFFAVDGHHRLAAYDAAEWKGPIAVEVFVGSLAEARMEALNRNIKDQLPMTQTEKREVAWQLVKEDRDLSERDIARHTTVSPGTAHNMRTKWKEIEAAGDEHLLKMDWVHARRWPAQLHDVEDWQREKTNAIYDMLVDSGLAHEFSKYPDLAMDALTRINSDWATELLHYVGREAAEWVLEQYDMEADASRREWLERSKRMRDDKDKMRTF